MLSDEILTDIASRKYHCLICDELVTAESRVWTCRACYRVYDHGCISTWHKKSRSDRSWSCPHCRAPQTKSPGLYKCWCGKVRSPERDIERPHSCGQSCGHKRRCPHPCTDLCHPGPHRPCTAMGPQLACFCGKLTTQVLCVDSKYGGYSCEEPCGKLLPCGKHRCPKPCHKGQCGSCRVKIPASCYCGRSHKRIECGRQVNESDPAFNGSYTCRKQCDHVLDCGFHKCTLKCHPLSATDRHVCALKPARGERCPCGKQTVVAILGREREDCLEELPTCPNMCRKQLSGCEHACALPCHTGPCAPCEVIVTKQCRCTLSKSKVRCSDEPEPCGRVCGATRTCGRHYCQETCCPFSKSGRERHQHKKNRFTSLETFLASTSLEDDGGMSDAELATHLCTKMCGRRLKCGNHFCPATCHPGPCATCYQSTSDDYYCPCGSVYIPAPIRCGTPIPTCTAPCPRPRECGHAAGHKCHGDGTECPPCTQAVQRACLCGKQTMPVQCHSEKIPRCVSTCDKLLKCGHRCPQVCHAGLCAPCTSPCLRELGCVAGHRHQAPCHGVAPCGPCRALDTARCPCGHLAAQFECGEALEVFCNASCVNREPAYDPVIARAYLAEPRWCQDVEKQLREFVGGDKKSLWLPAMVKSRRRYVHYLIEHYGCAGQSYDRGPKRSVCAWRTNSTWMPQHTIRRALELAQLHHVPGVESDDAGEEDEALSDGSLDFKLVGSTTGPPRAAPSVRTASS